MDLQDICSIVMMLFSEYVAPVASLATEQLPMGWMGVLTCIVAFSRYSRPDKGYKTKLITCFIPHSPVILKQSFSYCGKLQLFHDGCVEKELCYYSLKQRGKWWLSLIDLVMVGLSICVIVWEGLAKFWWNDSIA